MAVTLISDLLFRLEEIIKHKKDYKGGQCTCLEILPLHQEIVQGSRSLHPDEPFENLQSFLVMIFYDPNQEQVEGRKLL
jgi:hypothetical protein